MAIYKGREVEIVNMLPHPAGDQVVINHKELALGTEIVLKKDVTLTSEDEVKEAKEASDKSNDFKIEVEVKKDNTVIDTRQKAKK